MIVEKVSKSAAGAMFQYVSRCNSDTFQVSETDSRQIEKASPIYGVLPPAVGSPVACGRAGGLSLRRLSKISVKYAKISENIRQISPNFSQSFAPDWR